MMRKSNTVIFATVGVIVLVLLLGFGAFYLTTGNKKAASSNANTAATKGTAGMDVSNESDTINTDTSGDSSSEKGDTPDKTGTTNATASNQFGDGLYLVNSNIEAGTYKSDGTGDCSWQRLNALTGYKKETATGSAHGPTTVEILSTDKAFKSTGCGTWRLQS